ncbi:hypothetical protein ABPG74_014873 [Tetrahymena malaccensis]
MENANQDPSQNQIQVQQQMAEFENAIREGNFYNAVANFINLLSSGSQFEIKIDDVDLNKLDQQDDEKETQQKFQNHNNIYQSVKGINYEQIYNQNINQQQQVRQFTFRNDFYSDDNIILNNSQFNPQEIAILSQKLQINPDSFQNVALDNMLTQYILSRQDNLI